VKEPIPKALPYISRRPSIAFHIVFLRGGRG
jgi:hypothetical protein